MNTSARSHTPRIVIAVSATALAALLSACADNDRVLRVAGTAAVGAPIVGTVAASCASGQGTARSNANGTYSVEVTDGVGPCLLKITPDDNTIAPLYSMAIGTGSSFTANISPLTNMLVSYLQAVPGVTANDPETWFAQPATRALLSQPQEVQSRVTNDFIPSVKQLLPTFALADAGFLTQSFVPAAGDPVDDALEALRTAAVVTPSGAPSQGTSNALAQSAATAPPVTSTGGGAATGTGTGTGSN
jgi:5'-nucleotidase